MLESTGLRNFLTYQSGKKVEDDDTWAIRHNQRVIGLPKKEEVVIRFILLALIIPIF